MLKGLVASALLLGFAAPAIAKPPFEYHRESPRDRPALLDRAAERQAFDRARSDAGQREARQSQWQRLTPEQKERMCAQTGVCARTHKSEDVEDKTK